MRKPRHQLTQWMQSEESYEEWEAREKEAHENQRKILIQIIEGIKKDHYAQCDKSTETDTLQG